jgi:serine/threonine protein kinase, bacterial
VRPITKLTLSGGVEPYPGYHLTKRVGSGGWGEVWQASTPDGGSAALKFLPSDCQRATTQEVRALQAIRCLEHPNLLALENIWSCPGYLVLVMELADGNLLDLLNVYGDELHTPLPPDHLCFYLKQAAAGIDFLNKKQHLVNDQRVAFRHCDIKPSNLLLIGNTVKVADYSLAVQATTATCNSRRAGTPAYAAPEIFQGLLSDRTDQYSLAASYYHLRTGELPFDDGVKNFDAKHVRPMPDLMPFTERERGVLARAFAPMPLDRWPSCVEFMDRLTNCFVSAQKVG